ncbi:MAG: type IV pilus twitching motility protein PilT [Thermoanaerobacteraceae bacterium]|nr:type IV pilus twitching motility protein PilT [Thermoanaerobacteraceae bacterium]
MEFEELLRYMVDMGASDLHLAVGIPPTLRVNGLLKKMDLPMLKPDNTLKYAKDILDDRQFDLLEEVGEIDLAYSVLGVARYRINIFRQRGTYSFAVRLVSLRIPSIEELGLPPVVGDLAMKSRGLILVTGPTGSGKSTTLASMIDRINHERDAHIITLEDPIEYLHRHDRSIIVQREVGSDTRSFASGLRAALREDPDVILVGEMRDLETISTAITAAETGHLVMSTLHTIGAAKTIDRIIDVFPPHQQQQIRIQLANVLQGIISQQLLTTADEKGRVVAVEIMINTPAISNLIREDKTHQIQSTIQTGAKYGMISMDNSIAELYRKGRIRKEEAIMYAIESESLSRILSVSR